MQDADNGGAEQRLLREPLQDLREAQLFRAALDPQDVVRTEDVRKACADVRKDEAKIVRLGDVQAVDDRLSLIESQAQQRLWVSGCERGRRVSRDDKLVLRVLLEDLDQLSNRPRM